MISYKGDNFLCFSYSLNELKDYLTAHARKRLFRSFRSKIRLCHSLRRPRFLIKRVYFHYPMTFSAYIWCFCTQFSFDLVTLTFDLFTLAVSEEQRAWYVQHTYQFLASYDSLFLGYVRLNLITYTITWHGQCACAVSRDLSPGGKNDPHFWNLWP